MSDTIDIILSITRMREALAENSEDWDLRMVLSDAYEEAGDIGAAECLRWTVVKKKRPHFWGVIFETMGRWAWYAAHAGEHYHDDPESDLPDILFDAFEPHYEDSHSQAFMSHKEAEEALILAWKKLTPEGRDAMWRWGG